MVMVGAALLGLLAVLFSEMIGNAFKGQKSVQNAVDFDILKTSINMVLNTKACDGAFKDAAGNNVQFSFGSTPLSLNPVVNVIAAGTSVPVKKIMLGNSVVAETGAQLSGGLKVSKIEFVEAIYDGEHSVGTPAVLYKAFVVMLNVEAETAKNTFGNRNPKKSFSARVLLRPNAANSAGIVEKCSTSSASSSFSTIVTYDVNGTFVVPDGISKLMVEVWGAGGGGGGSSDFQTVTASGGGGGGGGEYTKAYLDVVPGQTFAVTIGAGGSGGAFCSNCASGAGNPGGFSSFGPQIVSLGGLGGTGATPHAVGGSGAGGTGGAGGAGAAGTLRQAGAPGGLGGYNYEGKTFVLGGSGGAAGGGGGGGGALLGQAGAVPGGGGAGGHRYNDTYLLRPGAPGARGRVVVHY